MSESESKTSGELESAEEAMPQQETVRDVVVNPARAVLDHNAAAIKKESAARPANWQVRY